MAAKKKGLISVAVDELKDVYGKEKLVKATLFGVICFVGGFYYILEIRD